MAGWQDKPSSTHSGGKEASESQKILDFRVGGFKDDRSDAFRKSVQWGAWDCKGRCLGQLRPNGIILLSSLKVMRGKKAAAKPRTPPSPRRVKIER